MYSFFLYQDNLNTPIVVISCLKPMTFITYYDEEGNSTSLDNSIQRYIVRELIGTPLHDWCTKDQHISICENVPKKNYRLRIKDYNYLSKHKLEDVFSYLVWTGSGRQHRFEFFWSSLRSCRWLCQLQILVLQP